MWSENFNRNKVSFMNTKKKMKMMMMLLLLLAGIVVPLTALAAGESKIPAWIHAPEKNLQNAWPFSAHYKEGVKCIACHGKGTEPLASLKAKGHPQAWSKTEAAGILPRKRTAYDALCARCHQAAVKNFNRTFHGKYARLGKQIIPTCTSCHAGHELPLTSTINALHTPNLGRVCAGCHGGSNARKQNLMAAHLTGTGIGKTLYGHDRFGLGPLRIRYLINGFYILVMAGMVGFVLFYIVVDFPVAFKERTGLSGSEERVKRFSFGQRLQHVILAASFITLALTGFAVKYPDSAYAQWLVPLLGGADNRSLIHRLAAVVFVGNAYVHFVYFLLFRRRSLGNIAPSLQDLRDAWQDIRFRLGKGPRPVHASKYDWLQKFEYWTGVIGLHVVLLTGLLMWFFEWTMSHFSYQIFKYAQWIHGWEAFIATVVVFFLHGYSTVVSPRVFPMDCSWITGRKTERISAKSLDTTE